jgi:hypothetical protein
MPSRVAGIHLCPTLPFQTPDGRDKPSHEAEDMAQHHRNELLTVFWMLRAEGAGG